LTGCTRKSAPCGNGDCGKTISCGPFYLEVKGSLELLRLLKDDALKGKSPADPGFACFTGKLRTQPALFFEGKGGGGPARRLKSE
jgi:hypothetical protein